MRKKPPGTKTKPGTRSSRRGGDSGAGRRTVTGPGAVLVRPLAGPVEGDREEEAPLPERRFDEVAPLGQPGLSRREGTGAPRRRGSPPRGRARGPPRQG